MWTAHCFRWILTCVTMYLITFGYCAAAVLPVIVALVGSQVELPCDLNVTSSEDEVSLVLWYRGDSGSPIYSVDARDTPLITAKHFPTPVLQNRAFLNASVTPALLKIENIEKAEEGTYRCRVEYRRARTESTEMVLRIIVPPREAIIMDEFGQHLRGLIGPFNEGFPLSLACEGEGGDPSPSVVWYHGSELLDDSFNLTPQGFSRNELLIEKLKRTDLLTTLTCQVYNSNMTDFVSSSVTLDINLSPTEVRITSLFRPLSAGRETELECVARGARPPAQVSWWLNGEQLTSQVTESSVKEDNLTVSTLTITLTPEDDQKNLSCRADNPQLPDKVLEYLWLLNVHYVPRLTARLDPTNLVVEGNDVALTCNVQAQPPITILEWLLDGKVIEKTTIPEIDQHPLQKRTLSLPAVGASNKGGYQCSATNEEGREISSSTYLTVHYAPKCQSVRGSVYGVGKTESVSVLCEVEAEPPSVTFFWMLNNSLISSALPTSHYYSNGTRRSIATLSPRSPQDYGVLYCWAKNSIGKQREPCSFRIIQAGPPGEPQNCIISNQTLHCITVECIGGEDGGLQQLFHLEVYGTNPDIFLVNQTTQKVPVFTACGLPQQEKLALVIYAINSKGKSKQVTIYTSTLSFFEEENGKSEDTNKSTVILGIITGTASVVLSICIITLLFIKCQKRGFVGGRSYQPESDKCDSELMKECKETDVPGNLGPDIIPEKRFFNDRPDSVPDIEDESQGGPSTVLPKTDPSSKKYYEFQTGTYSDSPDYIQTPKTLRFIQKEGEKKENSVTVETPLISSIPLAAQQWTDRAEGLRLSTPV